MVIAIEGYASIALEVREKEARAFRTEAEPALIPSAATAMRMLCGPLAPSAVLELPTRAAALDQWCPLPLFWSRQDGV